MISHQLYRSLALWPFVNMLFCTKGTAVRDSLAPGGDCCPGWKLLSGHFHSTLRFLNQGKLFWRSDALLYTGIVSCFWESGEVRSEQSETWHLPCTRLRQQGLGRLEGGKRGAEVLSCLICSLKSCWRPENCSPGFYMFYISELSSVLYKMLDLGTPSQTGWVMMAGQNLGHSYFTRVLQMMLISSQYQRSQVDSYLDTQGAGLVLL